MFFPTHATLDSGGGSIVGQATDAATCDVQAMTIATKAKRSDLETTISTLTPLDQLPSYYNPPVIFGFPSVGANASVLAAREYAIVQGNRQLDFYFSKGRDKLSFYFRGLLKLSIILL